MRSMLVGVLLLCPVVFGAEDWGALQYLIGNWTAEGGGTPGQATGSFSFTPDVQGKVLVRRSRAEYPATKERPASTHDDLLLVFRDPDQNADGAMRAMYFDSEGHVIRYTVNMFGNRIVFTSDPAGRGAPQYRFSYNRVAADEVRLKFEIAPPGGGFATYVDGAAKRAR